MIVCSSNVNGIRSAISKDAAGLYLAERVDVLLLQELKCDADSMPENPFPSLPFCVSSHAVKKGYSGTAVYSARQPSETFQGFGDPSFDQEGRICGALIGDSWFLSVYVPSGSSGPDKQASKDLFMPFFLEWMRSFVASAETKGLKVLVGGDFNVALTNLDLKNWKSNQKNSGYLPHEREWLAKFIPDIGFVDCYRALHSETPGYTWWSARGAARAKDVGWRIDYILSKGSTPIRSWIVSQPLISDHAPLFVELP